jgi:hypothetical protein
MDQLLKSCTLGEDAFPHNRVHYPTLIAKQSPSLRKDSKQGVVTSLINLFSDLLYIAVQEKVELEINPLSLPEVFKIVLHAFGPLFPKMLRTSQQGIDWPLLQEAMLPNVVCTFSCTLFQAGIRYNERSFQYDFLTVFASHPDRWGWDHDRWQLISIKGGLG